MAGLNLYGVFATRGLQRLEYPQILYLSEFHHIPLMWHLIKGCCLYYSWQHPLLFLWDPLWFLIIMHLGQLRRRRTLLRRSFSLLRPCKRPKVLAAWAILSIMKCAPKANFNAARLWTQVAQLKFIFDALCQLTVKDQAANPFRVLAWSYSRSRHFEPPSIFEAHAAMVSFCRVPLWKIGIKSLVSDKNQ